MPVISNFIPWRKELDRELQKRLDEQVECVKSVALTALGDVMELSPVDKGIYRASHNLQVNGVDDSVSSNGKSESQLPRGQIDVEAFERTAGRLENLPRSKNGMTITVSNHMGYAGALEHGHSQNAPEGVYAVAEERAKANLKTCEREFNSK